MIIVLLAWGDYGLLVLRVVLGIIMIAHGWPKLTNISGTTERFQNMGFRPARIWAPVVALVDVVGGGFIAFGIFTQIVALLISIQFVVVILKVTGKRGLVNGYEFGLLILVAAIALMTLGAGAISVDNLLGFSIY